MVSLIAVRVRDAGGDFILECTDFSGVHTADFRAVGTELGVAPVILDAQDIAPCRRCRAFWTSFVVNQMEVVTVAPGDILEPGRLALQSVLPTLMAAGTRSWNTQFVVQRSDGTCGPLLTVEMERAMAGDLNTWLANMYVNAAASFPRKSIADISAMRL